jgi:hypothetical protein
MSIGSPEAKPKPKCHGRRGAADYTGLKECSSVLCIRGSSPLDNDLYMSLIHTCFLNSVDPFAYLTVFEKHHIELDANPERWMPWNYRENLSA